MKKIGIIVAAMALILGLSQCKKEQTTTTNGHDAVAITLNIQNNGGTRMDVNTGTGEVTYETGDVIYVGSGGKFIGTLTHNGTNFAGTITNPTVGEPLDFYFLGNVTPGETLTAGTTTTCSVVISDQTEHLPVIEYAPSNETYTAGATTFTAHLLNKCALVKFNVTTSSTAVTYVTGFNNKVSVSFADASFAFSKVNNGNITLPAYSGEKWAILLPQEAMETGVTGSAYSADGTYTGTCGAVPTILDNVFLTTGIDVNVTTEVNPGEFPVGAINGKFTINADGDQVYFSQGNLQYQASTGIWRFAENQWNYSGYANRNISPTYDGWIDLFGWGTSGFNHGAVCYQPWSTSDNYSDYYAYGLSNNNLCDQSGQADWGYNAISNGGNMENQWRSLTMQEWFYLFKTRNTPSGIRWTVGKVNNNNGVILLPDDWSSSIYTLNNVNGGSWNYSHNIISSTDWVNILQANGAVFLPAAGSRYKTTVQDIAGGYGNYYSTTYYSDGMAYILAFDAGNANPQTFSPRYNGFSVRLVRDVE